MKAYSNKPQRVDPARCLYSEINQGNGARKKAARRAGKKSMKDESQAYDIAPPCQPE